MNDVPTPKISDPFTKMAEMIERNADAFGGAFVIVPPDGGAPVKGLMLSSADSVQFWLMLSSQINKSLEEAKAPANPYGQRR